MILLFLSILYSNIKLSSFKSEGLYAQDLNFSLSQESEWYEVFIELGGGSNFSSSRVEIALSDLILGLGVKRDVLGLGLSLFPLVQFPIGSKGLQRSFSIDGYGYGIGIGLESKIFSTYTRVNGQFITFETEPDIKKILFNTEMRFNPDTLTFGIDLSFEKYNGGGHDISSIYISPNVTFLKWKLFALFFGIDFRLSRETEVIPELEKVGVNTGSIGSPPWKISFGVLSKEKFQTTEKLIALRIILLDEKGTPANGLLSLADSGSFEINGGEIEFELSEGMYPLSIYAKNCIPVDTTIILKKDTELLLTIRDRKAFGVIEGKVLDAESDKPLHASLHIKNSLDKRIYTDHNTGSYRTVLPPGDYIIQTTAKDYFPRTSIAEITEGNVTILDFRLLPVR